MRLVFVLLVGTSLSLYPLLAHGQVTISDWKGLDVTVIERAVNSDSAGERPLVVIVHSIIGPWFDWRHQIPTLVAEHYQVAVMSTRGTDKSDKPEGVEHYTMAKIAEDIDSVITDLGHDTAILMGHDSGGFYVWHFAMTYPGKTDRLIAVGSVHPAGLRGMQENPDAAASFAERIRSRPPPPDEPPELQRLRREAYDRLYAESIVNFYKANWPRPPFTLETEGFGFRLGQFPIVQAPTLVIYGEDDGAFLPATLNDLWSHVDNSLTLHVLPDVGHGPHTEVSEVVTPRLVAWLATQQD